MWKKSKEYVVKGSSKANKAGQLLFGSCVPFLFEPYPGGMYCFSVKDEGQPVHSSLAALAKEGDGGASVEISFLASGHVNQSVRLIDKDITPDELVSMLNSGKASTTVQEDGTIEITATGRVIGIVEDVDNHMGYEDFEVK
jgi:hypothetical protein